MKKKLDVYVFEDILSSIPFGSIYIMQEPSLYLGKIPGDHPSLNVI